MEVEARMDARRGGGEVWRFATHPPRMGTGPSYAISDGTTGSIYDDAGNRANGYVNTKRKKDIKCVALCVTDALHLKENMTEIERKVDRVQRASAAYGLETPGMVVVQDVTHLSGDLRHYCDFIGKDLVAYDQKAYQQYVEEKDENGPIKFG
jgi:hypothetical protein